MRSRRILTLILAVGKDVVEEDMDMEAGKSYSATDEVKEDVDEAKKDSEPDNGRGRGHGGGGHGH